MSLRLACCLVVSASLALTAPAQDRSTERFDLAMGLIKRGLHDDAARQLSRFIDENPEHTRRGEACYRLGTCYLELDDSKRAIDAFRQALKGKAFKLRGECRYRLGHTLMQNDEPKAAAEQFLALVEEGGDKHYLAAPSLYACGECLRKIDAGESALSAYERAAALDKDPTGRFAASSLYQAGFIQLRAEKFREAEKLFQAAADRFPKHQAYGECRFLQGESALRGKRFDAATQAFTAAVGAGGDFADDAALGLGQVAVERKDVDAAVSAFRDVATKFPESPLVNKAMLECGRVLYGAKRHADAEQELSALLLRRRLPADVRWPALELRGLALLDLGESKKAAADLMAAIDVAVGAEDKGRMLYSLGEAFADGGDWENALSAYSRCHETTGDTGLKGDALYGQCLALHRLQRYQESNDVVVRFLQFHPKHRLRVQAVFAAGENAFAMKQYPQADGAYGEVPDDHELAGKAAFKGAWCSYLAGEHEKAARRFAALAGAKTGPGVALAEESLSMEALAWLEAGNLIQALQAADRYRSQYAQGSHLARTERVAARVLKRQNKLKAAASRLARAASAEKSGDAASGDQLEYAEVIFRQGDFAAAKKAYQALSSRPDEIGGRAHEGIAWCAFELGEDDDCKDWIQRGLKHEHIGPGRAGLLELLSALHHRRKEWGDAERVGEQFLRDFAEHPRADEMRYALGVAKARSDKLDEARRVLESLREAKMDRRDRALYELAWVCRKLKDEAAALAAFRLVADSSPDEDMAGEARLHVGEALLRDDAKVVEGLLWLEKVKGKYTARAQYLAGFHRFEAKQYAPAFANFERIVGLGPGGLYLEAQFFAAECQFRQDRHKDALPRYQELLEKQPDHERAQVARLHGGQSALEAGDAGAAAMVLQDYLRRAAAVEAQKSDLARAQLWLGKARQAQKDYDRAEQAYAAVTELTDSDLSAEAQFRIGECRQGRGSLGDAVDAFVKLSILYQHATWVQRGLFAGGDCYLKLKQPAKAAKLFQELVERFPKSELARSAQTRLKNIRSM